MSRAPRLTLPPSLRRLARRFRHDVSAVGAVEFVLVVPLLLTLYLAGTELSIAITVDRKVQNAAAVVGDLIAQEEREVTPEAIDGILSVSKALVEPYDTSTIKMAVTALWIDEEGEATVEWSRALNGAPTLARGAVYVLPGEFADHRERALLLTSMSYLYQPLGGYGLQTAIDMGETAYLHPRNGSRVACPLCNAPPTG